MSNTTTWVDGAAGSLFDVDNLPYGIFDAAANPGTRRAGLVLLVIGQASRLTSSVQEPPKIAR